MWPLQLLIALSGVALTVVTLGQNPEQIFTNPPPLPDKGMFTLLSIYEQPCAHILWCDISLMQNSYVRGIYKFLLQLVTLLDSYGVNVISSNIVHYKNISNNISHCH